MNSRIIASVVFSIGMMGLSTSTLGQSACQLRVYKDCMAQEKARPSPVRESAGISASEYCTVVSASECPNR